MLFSDMKFTEEEVISTIAKTNELEKKVKEFEELKEDLEERIRQLEEKVSLLVDTKVNNLLDSSTIKVADDLNVSIILTRYKKSILVKNKYTDKNPTIKCKHLFKELGAKWFKNSDGLQGWLFVSKFDESKTLEKNGEFILVKFDTYDFILEVEYE